MKKYCVSITEVNRGAAIVEAENEDEAMEIAMDVYYNGEVHWTDTRANRISARKHPLRNMASTNN
jgi:hypothetical protein